VAWELQCMPFGSVSEVGVEPVVRGHLEWDHDSSSVGGQKVPNNSINIISMRRAYSRA
jgi:hypothetical protein